MQTTAQAAGFAKAKFLATAGGTLATFVTQLQAEARATGVGHATLTPTGKQDVVVHGSDHACLVYWNFNEFFNAKHQVICRAA